jgi:NADH-quinone oxidoreductase subunit F
MSEEVDIREIDEIVGSIGRTDGDLIPILQAIQEKYHYLPETALRRIPEITDIRAASIMGVATFYDYFRLKPAGKCDVCVCHGTACHVKGSERIHEAVERHLGLAKGQDTDEEREYTVKRVACVGCCTLAPVVVIGDATYGYLTPQGVGEMFDDYESALAATGEVEGHEVSGNVPEIRVGTGSCCAAKGSLKVRDAFIKALDHWGVKARVRPVGCVGMCHQTPLVEVVWPDGGVQASAIPSALGGRGGRVARVALYQQVTPEDAERIVREVFQSDRPMLKVRAVLDRALDALAIPSVSSRVRRHELDYRDGQVCEYLGKQVHIATEHCGLLDPLDVDAYVRHDGFKALKDVLHTHGAEATITMMKQSGLRGRGGAGYPTGEKWAVTRGAPGDVKYAICNGDEGDPGAFMDRMILESYPYRVLEGLAIAAFCVGAREGVLYIRAEYPLAVRRVREAIDRMKAAGWLGNDIAGSGWSLSLKVMEGAGAFVCGEETALIESLEGRRGMPRLRPPYPAVKGLWGRPTNVNNVETLAAVPWVVRNGAEAHAAMGTAHSKGTKVFALTGKVRRGGLIEVPMGITVREIVEGIGGGVEEGRMFKAVQIGGPSGGCIPASLADMPVDYEELAHAGAIMGSGGLVVLDDRDCMVDIARFFLKFTQEQSCGQCTFCRVGTRAMLDILTRLCEGKGKRSDLDVLETLAHQVASGSLCALGQTAPNPVLTSLRYFRHEFEAHLEGRCPARKCTTLIHYEISDRCIGCTRCAQVCPVEAIEAKPYQQHQIDDATCTRCDLCRGGCPVSAIRVETGRVTGK